MQPWGRGVLQAEPFSFAATKIRIGRGPRCRYGRCRRAIPHCSSDDAASIPKSGLEIKNRCTLEGINRQNLALIRKSGHEIKNQCSRGVVAVCRRNHSPLPLRKLESDADLVAATTTAGGPFFSAAKKIRIGHGESLQKAAPAQKPPRSTVSRNENKHKKQYLC